MIKENWSIGCDLSEGCFTLYDENLTAQEWPGWKKYKYCTSSAIRSDEVLKFLDIISGLVGLRIGQVEEVGSEIRFKFKKKL